jgi:hypothetical protein
MTVGFTSDGGKIGLPAMALRRSDELNDVRAQDNFSHTAMTTSPTNASAIKYAVMAFSFVLNQSRGMIACDHFRHEPDLHQKEDACGRELGPRRVPANEGRNLFSQETERCSLEDFSSTFQGSDGSPLAPFRRCR